MASFLDFFEVDQDVKVSLQIVTIVAVFVVTIVTFSLRETKGAPLPERIETMPQVGFTVNLVVLIKFCFDQRHV